LNLKFSILIPVYNRPQEMEELLGSLTRQDYSNAFEVIVIEDGSTQSSEAVVKKYKHLLELEYYKKENSGPGWSRNFGMQKAKGNYFIILDSDCILPKEYLKEVSIALKNNYTDAFGGPDASHKSFTAIQKAINYAMTSMLTTGGIRGHKKGVQKFQPRSFNMGMSKNAFQKTKGYASQRYGEDIDLSFRLWKHNFKTQLISKAFVYHKRRANIKQFYEQTFNFGAARPILNKQHLNTSKITYWFPSLFALGFLFSILLGFFRISIFLKLYGLYFVLIFVDSLVKNRSVAVAALSILTSFVQFLGYGLGFLRSTYRLTILNNSIEETFPKMFNRE